MQVGKTYKQKLLMSNLRYTTHFYKAGITLWLLTYMESDGAIWRSWRLLKSIFANDIEKLNLIILGELYYTSTTFITIKHVYESKKTYTKNNEHYVINQLNAIHPRIGKVSL